MRQISSRSLTKNIGTKTGGAIVGAVGVRLLDKATANINPNVQNLGEAAIGLVGPTLLKAKPGSVIDKTGDAIFAISVYKLTGGIGALNGIGNILDLNQGPVIGTNLIDEDVIGSVNEE